MRSLLTWMGIAIAAGGLLLGVGIVTPEAPVAGAAAEAVMTLLEGADADGASPTGRKRTYYQYIEDGQVRFAAKRTDVPEEWRGRAGRVELDVPPPLTPGQARDARQARASAASEAREGAPASGARPGVGPRPKVIVYGAPAWNEDSKKALAYLDGKHIPYELKDIDHGPNFAEMQVLADTDRVPIIKVGNRFVKGWSSRRFQKLYAGEN